MRLTDLKPKWVGIHNWSSDEPYFIGVTFQDPKTPGVRLGVLFEPPIDPSGLTAKYGWGQYFPDQKKWKRTGDTFETLTLSPSLDFSGCGQWHGHIANGEVQ